MARRPKASDYNVNGDWLIVENTGQDILAVCGFRSHSSFPAAVPHQLRPLTTP